MKIRKYVNGISFSASMEMYEQLKDMARNNDVSLGETIRELLSNGIQKERNTYDKDNLQDGVGRI